MWTAKGIVFFVVVSVCGLQRSCQGSDLITFPFRFSPFCNTFQRAPINPFFDDPLDSDFFTRQMNLFPFEDSFFPEWSWPEMRTQGLRTIQRNDKSGISMALDVGGYLPEELSLRIADGELVVQGEHKSHGKREGCFEKRFLWRRTLPNDVNPDSIKAKLASNGELLIEAKKEPESIKKIEIDKVSERGGDDLTPDTKRMTPEEPKFTSPASKADPEDDVTVEVVPEHEPSAW